MTTSTLEQWKKHIPWIEITEDKLVIKVWFEIEHPMMEKHFIKLIDVLRFTKAGYISLKQVTLTPNQKPQVEFDIKDWEAGTYKIQAHCNIHWVWENEILI